MIIFIAITFLTLLAAAWKLAALPALVLYWYLILSGLTLIIYAIDKWLAIKDYSRVSEKKLHLLSLFGGWPGALIAQQSLRHKTLKQPFRKIFWLSLTTNLAIFMACFTVQGQTLLAGLTL